MLNWFNNALMIVCKSIFSILSFKCFLIIIFFSLFLSSIDSVIYPDKYEYLDGGGGDACERGVHKQPSSCKQWRYLMGKNSSVCLSIETNKYTGRSTKVFLWEDPTIRAYSKYRYYSFPFFFLFILLFF